MVERETLLDFVIVGIGMRNARPMAFEISRPTTRTSQGRAGPIRFPHVGPCFFLFFFVNSALTKRDEAVVESRLD